MEDGDNRTSCLEDPSSGVLGPWACGAWACADASQCWNGLYGTDGATPLRHRATCVENTGVLLGLGSSPARVCACIRGFYGALCERETPELLTFRSVRGALLVVELLLLVYGVLTVWQAFRQRLLRMRSLWFAMVASLFALISHALWSSIVIAGSVGSLSLSGQRSLNAAFLVVLAATGALMYCETLATSVVWLTVLGMRRGRDGARCGWSDTGLVLTFLLTLPIGALFLAGFKQYAFVACLPLLCITSVTFGVVVLRVNAVNKSVRWAEHAAAVVVSPAPTPAPRLARPVAGLPVDSSGVVASSCSSSSRSSNKLLFASARRSSRSSRSGAPQQHSLSSMRVFCKWFPAVWRLSLHADARGFAPGERTGESARAGALHHPRPHALQNSLIATSTSSSRGLAISLGQRQNSNKASLLIQSLQQISVAATAMSLALLVLLVGAVGYYSYWTSPRLGGEPTAMLFFLLISVGQDLMNASVVVYVRSAFLVMLRLRAERASVVRGLDLVASALSQSQPPPPAGVDDDPDGLLAEQDKDARLDSKAMRAPESPERG
jgi:hypothetical protein